MHFMSYLGYALWFLIRITVSVPIRASVAGIPVKQNLTDQKIKPGVPDAI
jgi:hypothetical protein